jgi:putative tricarboxylic transport membrane protein
MTGDKRRQDSSVRSCFLKGNDRMFPNCGFARPSRSQRRNERECPGDNIEKVGLQAGRMQLSSTVGKVKKYQICTAFFWVALGLFVSLYSYRLGLGGVGNPGPGFFPFCLGLIFFLLAVVILINTLLQAEQSAARMEGRSSASVSRVGAVAATLFAYSLLLEVMGFQVTTFIALAVLFRLGGYKRLIQVLGYSGAVVAITYFLFTYLGVQFPPGVFRLVGLG